jgi:hypothetical protein
MRVLFVLACFAFCFSSCLSNRQEEKNTGVHPDLIYHDYKLTAEEGREEVTLMLQYRLGGEDGDPFLLDGSGKVSLDGMELKPDSAKLAGTFYEVSRPMEQFSGKHTIVFTDSREKEHKAEFRFEPFTLANEVPEQTLKRPFTIKLNNVPANPITIRLVMIDTSYGTTDVNEDLLIQNGEISIDNEKLANLASGPVTLEIYREEIVPLKGFSKEGGRISMTYGLRRQFEFIE